MEMWSFFKLGLFSTATSTEKAKFENFSFQMFKFICVETPLTDYTREKGQSFFHVLSSGEKE